MRRREWASGLGSITGLTEDEHGFHVHPCGENTQGRTGASPRSSSVQNTVGRRIKRHVGDLGSVTAGNDGVVNVSTEDSGSYSQAALPSLDA